MVATAMTDRSRVQQPSPEPAAIAEQLRQQAGGHPPREPGYDGQELYGWFFWRGTWRKL